MQGSVVDASKLRFDFSHKSAVSPAELKKIEDLSNAYIRREVPVFSEEVDLDRAREIDTLRAVFGESYPNPVRVVSLGVSVSDLLKDPKKPEWQNVSVEFCGGTHVANTELIKDLVIIEESGIAKGIRRVVAFTGDAAHQVQRLAEEFGKQLELIEGLPYGPEKEKQVKDFQQTLSQATLATLSKDDLKARVEKVSKGILDEQKKRQKLEAKTALETVQKHFTDNPDSKVFVGHLPISANAKALSEVVKHFSSKDKEKTVHLFAGGKDYGAVVQGLYVGTVSAPKKHSEGSLQKESRELSANFCIVSFRQGRYCREPGWGGHCHCGRQDWR